MKKKIEIDNDNIIEIAFNMLIVATAAINTEVELRSKICVKILDRITRKYLAIAIAALGGLDVDREQSNKTLCELKKLVLH